MGRFGIALVLFALMASGYASASASIDWVKIDNDELTETGTNFIRDLERGEEFEVKVHVTGGPNASMNDAQVEATIRGSHNDDISDSTDTFDIKAGVSYVKRLTLKLPEDMDQDSYKLRVRLEDRAGATVQQTYELSIDTQRNKVIIKDVVFNPAESVMAGRSLLTIVRLENLGEKDEDGIKVKVAVPEFGISASDFIDELEADESTTSEELYMRLPPCAEPGDYKVKVTVTYDDGDRSVSKEEVLTVTEDESCAAAAPPVQPREQTVISVPASQSVVAGKGVVYPVTVSNTAPAARTYALAVSGIDAWGTARIDPSNVLLVPAGDAKTAYVFVSAKEDASPGTYSFSLTVTSGTESRVVPIEAVVQQAAMQPASGWANIKKGLEIALVVLVVVLVILGLIIGFNKLRGEEEEEEEPKGQTYY